MIPLLEDYEDMAGEIFEINFVSIEDYLEELFWSVPKEEVGFGSGNYNSLMEYGKEFKP